MRNKEGDTHELHQLKGRIRLPLVVASSVCFILGRMSNSQVLKLTPMTDLLVENEIRVPRNVSFSNLTNLALKVVDNEHVPLIAKEDSPVVDFQKESSRSSRNSSSSNLLYHEPYFLNDRTLRLSPYVERPWLQQDVLLSNRPPAKIVLTDFAWNNRNVTKGLLSARSLRQRDLMQAIIDHPYFDPTFSWSDYIEGRITPDPSLQYYVFLDVETCQEGNYPVYGGTVEDNSDMAGGRKVVSKNLNLCYLIFGCDSYIRQVLESPLFKENQDSTKLVYIDCRGDGPSPRYRKQNPSPQLSIVSLSSDGTSGQLLNSSDMGLPPPSVNPVRLTLTEKKLVETCESEQTSHRPWLFSFVGAYRGRGEVRQSLFDLNFHPNVFSVARAEFRRRWGNTTFQQVLKESSFSGTPRGDNLFSYRFTEVMSSGAIPVIYADNWVLPFRKELVDWDECAVVIPEQRANETINILNNIDIQTRCQMRKRCLEIYQKYMANSEGTIFGIIETLERMRKIRQSNRTL